MSTFQLIVTGVFVALIVIGVGTFALFGGLLGRSAIGTVTIWGTADSQIMQNLLSAMRQQDKDFQQVAYVERSADTYEGDIINAIAAGQGPDIILLTQEQLGALADKVNTIPYSAVSQSTFTNSFIDEGRIFLNGQGSWALPFMIDPLVMYWNRDLLSSAGIAQPPAQWNEFLTLAPKITSLDSSQNVRKSAVALGTWDNVSHAKEILSAFFMQAGDPIVTVGQGGILTSVFGQQSPGASENPAASALRFFTEFANPAKSAYSWNRALPNSTVAFTAGDTAIYFGFASELPTLAARNPNLHFSVAVLPQLSAASQLTFGLLTGLAIPRTAHNPNGGLVIAEKLSSQAGQSALAAASGLPSVRRDVTLDTSANSAAQVFVQSALIARGWFDPNEARTSELFKGMIESVTTGSETPAQAVSEASQEFNAFFSH